MAKFNQVDDERNRRFEGTGLGLAISQQLIRLMDGKIWCHSEEGVGSTFGFQICLPLVAGADVPRPIRPEKVRRVLLVDAHDANRVITAKQLGQLGIDVVECASGTQALDRAGPDIDLILTDHNMARMDGLELSEALRETGHQMPIVLLSSNTGYADQDPARALLHAVLQKPVARRDLIAMLQSLETETASAPAPSNIAVPQRPMIRCIHPRQTPSAPCAFWQPRTIEPTSWSLAKWSRRWISNWYLPPTGLRR